MPPLLSQLRAFPEENAPQSRKRRRFSKADVHVSQHKEDELDGMLSDTKPVVLPADVTSVGHAEKVVVAPRDTRRATSRIHNHRTTNTSATGPRPQRRSNQFSPLSTEANCINPQLPNVHVNHYTATFNVTQDSSQASQASTAQSTTNNDSMLDTPSNCIADEQYSNVDVTLPVDEMAEFCELVNTRRSEGLTKNQLASILYESNHAHHKITSKTVRFFELQYYGEAHMLFLYPVFKRWTDDRHRRASLPRQGRLARLSIQQYDILNDEFSKTRLPTAEAQRNLATSLGLRINVIKNWFSNQRARHRGKNGSKTTANPH
ncbi:uncharacterized protein LOC135829223 [Sycon ciliatum]|uniref:uncharacterized protein LOC135829223 n=1 Tax=Sycon ciliatum TaxID=27933 RepID=UPI0031F6AF0E